MRNKICKTKKLLNIFFLMKHSFQMYVRSGILILTFTRSRFKPEFTRDQTLESQTRAKVERTLS